MLIIARMPDTSPRAGSSIFDHSHAEAGRRQQVSRQGDNLSDRVTPRDPRAEDGGRKGSFRTVGKGPRREVPLHRKAENVSAALLRSKGYRLSNPGGADRRVC